MTVTIKPRLSGIPAFVFVIDSKTGTEKSANTNKKKRKTKPITETRDFGYFITGIRKLKLEMKGGK